MNFNNKVDLHNNKYDNNIVFTTPINLFNTPVVKEYKPNKFKPDKDMITPIINFIKENKTPIPYTKNLLKI